MIQMTRGRRQIIIGEVVSDKMNKTVSVRVERKIPHPVYKKYVKKFSKFFADCDKFSPKEGDIVKIASMRPKSKNKRWRVIEIIRESIKIG
tara:strand:- start:22 stop:294 length:273 start_codon:yes stop_codon:yes gene_type:complete